MNKSILIRFANCCHVTYLKAIISEIFKENTNWLHTPTSIKTIDLSFICCWLEIHFFLAKVIKCPSKSPFKSLSNQPTTNQSSRIKFSRSQSVGQAYGWLAVYLLFFFLKWQTEIESAIYHSVSVYTGIIINNGLWTGIGIVHFGWLCRAGGDCEAFSLRALLHCYINSMYGRLHKWTHLVFVNKTF